MSELIRQRPSAAGYFGVSSPAASGAVRSPGIIITAMSSGAENKIHTETCPCCPYLRSRQAEVHFLVLEVSVLHYCKLMRMHLQQQR